MKHLQKLTADSCNGTMNILLMQGIAKMRSTKFWIIIFLSMILLSAPIMFLTIGSPGTKVSIYQDGNLIKEIDLFAYTQPQSFSIESKWGINVIEIEGGRVRVLYADCPDMTCVRQSWVSDSSTPIICLPHRLVVRLCDGRASGVDTVIG